jgi:rhodanese-related sulfurtransferase
VVFKAKRALSGLEVGNSKNQSGGFDAWAMKALPRKRKRNFTRPNPYRVVT